MSVGVLLQRIFPSLNFPKALYSSLSTVHSHFVVIFRASLDVWLSSMIGEYLFFSGELVFKIGNF